MDRRTDVWVSLAVIKREIDRGPPNSNHYVVPSPFHFGSAAHVPLQQPFDRASHSGIRFLG